MKVKVDDKGNFTMPDAAVTCTFTNDRSVVVPTQPTVTAEICDPNVPGAQLPGSITIPANPDYAYFIDGVATAAGTYPKPAGSYKVTAQLIVTKPVLGVVAAAARSAGRLHLDRGGPRFAGLPDPGQGVHPGDRTARGHRPDGRIHDHRQERWRHGSRRRDPR